MVLVGAVTQERVERQSIDYDVATPLVDSVMQNSMVISVKRKRDTDTERERREEGGASTMRSISVQGW